MKRDATGIEDIQGHDIMYRRYRNNRKKGITGRKVIATGEKVFSYMRNRSYVQKISCRRSRRDRSYSIQKR